MLKLVCALSLLLTAARWASGQIFYEPVKYQFGQGAKFYYAGSDPAIIAFGCAQIYSTASGAQPIIYSDARPYENVAINGYSLNDVRNEAYANVPCYFRKRDLIAAGNRSSDGSIVISAKAQPVEARPNRGAAQIRPEFPQPILIIPRGHLLPPPPKSNNVIITMN